MVDNAKIKGKQVTINGQSFLLMGNKSPLMVYLLYFYGQYSLITIKMILNVNTKIVYNATINWRFIPIKVSQLDNNGLIIDPKSLF